MNPAASRAARTCPTWPSIIPDNPSIPDPARACARPSRHTVRGSRRCRPARHRRARRSAVIGELVEAQIGHDDEPVADRVSDRPGGDVEDPGGSSAPLPPASPFARGTPNSMIPPESRLDAPTGFGDQGFDRMLHHPGIAPIGTGASIPARTNTGRTSSAGCSQRRRDEPPQPGVARSHCGRTAGNDPTGAEPTTEPVTGRASGGHPPLDAQAQDRAVSLHAAPPSTELGQRLDQRRHRRLRREDVDLQPMLLSRAPSPGRCRRPPSRRAAFRRSRRDCGPWRRR